MIVADVSIVHPAVLGTPPATHVLVAMKKEGTAQPDGFIRKLRAREEVRRAWYVTGEADFVLLLQVRDMEA